MSNNIGMVKWRMEPNTTCKVDSRPHTWLKTTTVNMEGVTRLSLVIQVGEEFAKFINSNTKAITLLLFMCAMKSQNLTRHLTVRHGFVVILTNYVVNLTILFNYIFRRVPCGAEHIRTRRIT